MYKFLATLLATTAICTAITGCDTGPSSPKGFSLPIGDKVKGEQVFEKHQCLSCHMLVGSDKDTKGKTLDVPIAIGGSVTRIVTYAELVTSVINPSHTITDEYRAELVEDNGESKMKNYNDVLTITELIDLVAFLQPHYELKAYENTYYINFH